MQNIKLFGVFCQKVELKRFEIKIIKIKKSKIRILKKIKIQMSRNKNKF